MPLEKKFQEPKPLKKKSGAGATKKLALSPGHEIYSYAYIFEIKIVGHFLEPKFFYKVLFYSEVIVGLFQFPISIAVFLTIRGS